ncbi:PH domain-containing protein [bacterium]|jgi:uncharacterized membrane protein YdbT with pleckstrin-like domain|nr:PH domain-containing protein [bacterium]MBT6832153.1 PH domain-containing protein [bacterium]MBT6996401.1 PH domain-containing protein [bacterium]MBT7772136.1 PH domain-containing protein [bacterium]
MKLEKYIGPGETIKIKFGISERWFFGQIFPLIVIFGVLIFFWRDNVLIASILSGIIWMIIFWRTHGFFSTKYFATDKKIYKLTGFLWKKLESAAESQLENIAVKQSFVARFLFGMGTLKFQTAGANNSEISLVRVDDPWETKQKIESAWQK